MADIVITEFMDEAAVDELRQRFDVRYDPELVADRAALLAAVAPARAVIVRNRTSVDAALLAAAEKLQIVGRLGVGLDNIDQEACQRRNVAVQPATGANAATVAEYVITAALALRRPVFWSSESVMSGDWPRPALSQGRELGGARLGLVGFGTIARTVAAKARGLDMAVMAHDPAIPASDTAWAEHGVTPCDLDELLATADVVSLHVPLTAGTRNLLDGPRLAAMKAGAILINTARGGIVDEAALADKLHTGPLGGAALDVFEQEPLPAGSALADAPNLLATPHVAGVTADSNERVSWMIAERVADALKAEAPA